MPPSVEHEALVQLFRDRPELAAELLRDALHLELPTHTSVRIESAELTEIAPAEYRADLVLLLEAGGATTLGVILEVQLERKERKRFTWPAYATSLRRPRGPHAIP